MDVSPWLLPPEVTSTDHLPFSHPYLFPHLLLHQPSYQHLQIAQFTLFGFYLTSTKIIPCVMYSYILQ